jgi:hypothetical protein
VISSRPEWHLKPTLSDSDFHGICKREELRLDDIESHEDARRLLAVGFDKIQKRFNLPDGWPSKSELSYIATVASGHLGFVSFILGFIQDEACDDPDGQLKVCMKFFGGDGIIGAISPLHALDLLYRQILNRIPPHRLPTIMRILGLLIYQFRFRLRSSEDMARFLNLDQSTFHQSLRNLQSIIHVPLMSEFHTAIPRIYHASFSDFLLDFSRSGKYWVNSGAVIYDFAGYLSVPSLWRLMVRR